MKITVITVCLNSKKTIEKTIKSVITQNRQNWDLEYIVVSVSFKIFFPAKNG